MEEWKSIKGYEGLYEVSSYGNVKSLTKYIKNKYNSYSIRKEKLLKINHKKLKNSKRINCYVSLTLYGKSKSYLVHRLVGIAFIINNENKPEINHIDGNTENNNVNNLEWVTTSENQLHAFKKGLNQSKKGEDNKWSKLSTKDVIEIREKYKSGKYTHKQLSIEYNCCRTNILNIVNYINWKHV